MFQTIEVALHLVVYTVISSPFLTFYSSDIFDVSGAHYVTRMQIPGCPALGYARGSTERCVLVCHVNFLAGACETYRNI